MPPPAGQVGRPWVELPPRRRILLHAPVVISMSLCVATDNGLWQLASTEHLGPAGLPLGGILDIGSVSCLSAGAGSIELFLARHGFRVMAHEGNGFVAAPSSGTLELAGRCNEKLDLRLGTVTFPSPMVVTAIALLLFSSHATACSGPWFASHELHAWRPTELEHAVAARDGCAHDGRRNPRLLGSSARAWRFDIARGQTVTFGTWYWAV